MTHPCAPSVDASLDEQREMARRGAVLEQVLAYSMPQNVPAVEPRRLIESIRAVGAEHCVIASDFGRPYYPDAVEGMRMFIALLLELGITPDEIATMARVNPAWLMGLDGPEAASA